MWRILLFFIFCIACGICIWILLRPKKMLIGGSAILRYLHELPKSSKDIWDREDIQPNQVLRDMYRQRFILHEGQQIKYTSGISPREGWHLYNLVKQNSIKKCLEVGMANGTSALYICQALKDGKGGSLISIDPYQNSQWANVGLAQIKKAGLQKFHSLIEKTSDIALSELLEKGEIFDLVFVDGMHLFDYTLLDIYFATKLLRIGGLLVVDDARHAGVRDALRYVRRNYTMLRYISDDMSASTMATFTKTQNDNRTWDFHKKF